MKKFNVLFVIGVFLMGTLILTANLTAEQPKGPNGLPPQVEACKNKKAGDACSFKTRDNKSKTDVCKEIETPKGNELSCGEMPKPPKGGEKPPVEK